MSPLRDTHSAAAFEPLGYGVTLKSEDYTAAKEYLFMIDGTPVYSTTLRLEGQRDTRHMVKVVAKKIPKEHSPKEDCPQGLRTEYQYRDVVRHPRTIVCQFLVQNPSAWLVSYPYDGFQPPFTAGQYALDATRGRLQEHESQITHDLLSALAFMHDKQRLVHWHITTETILIRDLRGYLTTFTNVTDNVANSRVTPGQSDAFTAPELLTPTCPLCSRTVRLRNPGKADIYSLGVVLYMLFSGLQEPFPRTWRKVLTLSRTPPGSEHGLSRPASWPKSAEPVFQIVKAMLVGDPNRRLSARDLLTKLYHS